MINQNYKDHSDIKLNYMRLNHIMYFKIKI